MKSFLLAVTLIFTTGVLANDDTLFWRYAANLDTSEVGRLNHEWGHESIRYLGSVRWTTASGNEKTIRIITSYRQITEANGFNDQSILALVKPDYHLIKTYDMVKRKNLPIAIRNNKLVYHPAGSNEELEVALPVKLGVRFCVPGMTCFNQIRLHHGH